MPPEGYIFNKIYWVKDLTATVIIDKDLSITRICERGAPSFIYSCNQWAKLLVFVTFR